MTITSSICSIADWITYCMAELKLRISKYLLASIVVVLVVSLIGHYAADAATRVPETGGSPASNNATRTGSIDAAPGGASLLHTGLIIGNLAPIEALIGLTLAMYVSSSFRLFPPLPSVWRPPISGTSTP